MKQVYLSLIFLFFTLPFLPETACGQQPKDTLASAKIIGLQDLNAQSAAETEKNLRIFQMASRNHDPEVAIVALTYYLEENPWNIFYIDSVLHYYKISERNEEGISYGLQFDRNQLPDYSVQCIAEMYYALRDYKKAIEWYNLLYLRIPDAYVKYQVAACEFYLGRLEECKTSALQVVAMPNSDSLKIVIYDKSGPQYVKIRAAAYNLLGNLARSQEKRDEAIAAFQQALDIQADFHLARANFDAMKKE